MYEYDVCCVFRIRQCDTANDDDGGVDANYDEMMEDGAYDFVHVLYVVAHRRVQR